jgi:regulatory protein
MSSSEWTTGRRRGRRDPRGRDRAAADPRTFVCNSLAAKAQSVGEIEAKLAARGVGPEEAAAAISEAIRLGYLDDAELAGQLARGLRSRGYGRRRALQTLRRRRLPSAVAEIALEDAYGDVDEDALARARSARGRSVTTPRAGGRPRSSFGGDSRRVPHGVPSGGRVRRKVKRSDRRLSSDERSCR